MPAQDYSSPEALALMTAQCPTPTPASPADTRTIVVMAPRQTLPWVIAGVLAVIATLLALRPGEPGFGGSPAFAQTGMLGARGLFAFTGQLNQNTFGLWMMDVDAGTVWCYEYNPIKKKMRLAAARSFVWDRYLEEINQDDPTPAQVKQMLDEK